jgi:hypothetical protein
VARVSRPPPSLFERGPTRAPWYLSAPLSVGCFDAPYVGAKGQLRIARCACPCDGVGEALRFGSASAARVARCLPLGEGLQVGALASSFAHGNGALADRQTFGAAAL